MPEHSADDLPLLARVAAGVYGREVSRASSSYRGVDGWPHFPRPGSPGYHDGFVPDFLSDDAAAFGLLEKLAEDGRIGGWYVYWGEFGRGDYRYFCDITVKHSPVGSANADNRRRAIVLAVDAMLAAEKEGTASVGVSD